MTTVRSQLNQIWGVFRSAGIGDDLTIIEHVAALLLEMENISPPSSELQPRKTDLRPAEQERVQHLLQDLIGEPQVQDAGTLLDRFALFRLPEMLPGQRYPIPRHVVRFMHHISNVQPQHRLADFTCGSGGMLALRQLDDRTVGTTYGCDISAEWTRLAWANCALHKVVARIDVGDAFLLTSSSFQDTLFDRLLLAPPFTTSGGRSVKDFIDLTLNKLDIDGRACVLAPGGPLFRSGADRQLREQLVDQYQLHAVIALPKDAFQPFSPIPTFVILAQNTAPVDDQRTWFFRAERDGYRSGRSRDLTELPNEVESDLPIIERLLTQSVPIWNGFTSEIRFAHVSPPNSYPGVLISPTDGYALGRVERATAGLLFLITAKSLADGQQTVIGFDQSSGIFEIVNESRDAYLRRKLSPGAGSDLHTIILLREEDRGDQIVITADGRLLGMRVPRPVIHDKQYDLRPDRYVHAEEQRQQSKAPASLLADIRKNQHKLLRHVDRLLGRLEMPPAAGDQVLPLVWTDDHTPISPFGTFSAEQQKVWSDIQQRVRPVSAAENAPYTPVYFTAAEIEQSSNISGPTTRMTIDLLQHMGLIVEVTLKNDDASERMTRYRLVSERDRWNVRDPDAAEQNEAA